MTVICDIVICDLFDTFRDIKNYSNGMDGSKRWKQFMLQNRWACLMTYERHHPQIIDVSRCSRNPKGPDTLIPSQRESLGKVIWPPLFILGDGIKSPTPSTTLYPPPVVRTDLYQGPERARHQCPAVSSANVCSTNKLNSRPCFTIARLCFTI